jgi:hypothetical protein
LRKGSSVEALWSSNCSMRLKSSEDIWDKVHSTFYAYIFVPKMCASSNNECLNASGTKRGFKRQCVPPQGGYILPRRFVLARSNTSRVLDSITRETNAVSFFLVSFLYFCILGTKRAFRGVSPFSFPPYKVLRAVYSPRGVFVSGPILRALSLLSTLPSNQSNIY